MIDVLENRNVRIQKSGKEDVQQIGIVLNSLEGYGFCDVRSKFYLETVNRILVRNAKNVGIISLILLT